MQRITEDPLKKCPTCGAKVTKLISQSAFHLKGSGWYITDYGKNGAKDTSSGKTAETKSSDAETKEGKPESKSTSESSPSTQVKETAAA